MIKEKKLVKWNKYKNKIEKGFTLIELMVATAIFSIVAVVGISILLASQEVYKRISATRNATDNLNIVMDAITREIKFGTNYACAYNESKSFNDIANTNYINFSFPDMRDYNASDDKCTAIAFAPEGENSTTPQKVSVFYFDSVKGSINKVDYNYNSENSKYSKVRYDQMTSSDLKVDKFVIKVTGSKLSTDTITAEYLQPGVSIFISGIINLQKNKQGQVVSTSTFALQSFVSQRLLDK